MTVAGRLQDKVALITGGASGIGRAAALRFAREGAKVMIADRNPALSSETLAQLLEITPYAASVSVDVSKTDQVQRMMDETAASFGGLDVLVNAAGVLLLTPPFAEIDERDWDLIMSTNLKGLFFCCKYAIPAMAESGGGSIVNIASQAGLRGYGVSLPYAVSKAGVIHLTTTAAAQYTSEGIRVNAIAPGPIDTPQMRGSTASTEAFDTRGREHPMGRAGRPEEIANMILFLASDEASFVSGSTFLVDGGAGSGAH